MEQLRKELEEALTLDRPQAVRNVLKTSLEMVKGSASLQQLEEYLLAVQSATENTDRNVYLAAEEIYIMLPRDTQQ